jgi:rare lipoprotein A
VTRSSLFRRLSGACAALVLCAPAAARADEPTGGTQAPEPVAPAPASGVVSVSGPVTVTARADTLLGTVARFRGTARARDAGRRVVVQRFDERRSRWVAAARTVVDPKGGFVARWRTDRSGRLRIRAVLRPRAVREAQARAPRALTASAELGVTVYRPAFATWYGPGFFGNDTACGIKLAPDTIGVAHRTLPCGTQVALYYRGHTLTVPVIDRGPFNGNARWDLTQATAQSLGMSASDTVGAVRVP